MGDIMGAFNEAVGLTEDPAEVQRQSAEMQRSAASEANQLQREMWQAARTDQAPFLQAGTSAVNLLSQRMTPGGADSLLNAPSFKFDPRKVSVSQDPGYRYRMQSGVDAITAAGAAAGNLGSGNMGTALTKFGQDLGSQEYAAAYGRAYASEMDKYNADMLRQNTIYNRLAGLSGTGQVTAGQLSALGANVASNMGVNLTNAAALAGQNMVGAAGYQAASMRGAGNQLAGIGNQLAKYYAQQNAMNSGGGYGGYDGYGDNWGGAGGYGWDGGGATTSGGYGGADTSAMA